MSCAHTLHTSSAGSRSATPDHRRRPGTETPLASAIWPNSRRTTHHRETMLETPDRSADNPLHPPDTRQLMTPDQHRSTYADKQYTHSIMPQGSDMRVAKPS